MSETMADESAPVFRKHFTAIVTGIQSSVLQVASKCYERGLIVKSELQFITDASEVDTFSKAQKLLMSIEDSIKINQARFDTFVEILEEEPAYKDLVRILRDGAGKRVPQEEGSSVSTLPSRSVSQFSSKARLISANPDNSSNPRLIRRALSDSGGIQSGVKEWGYVEGEHTSCQESSPIHFPNSDVYLQSFQKLGGDVAALKRESEIALPHGETIPTDMVPVVERETSSSFQSEDQSDSLAGIAADLTNVSKKLMKKDVEERQKDARIEDLETQLAAKEKERREQLEEAIHERNLMEMKLKEKDRETERIKHEKDQEIKVLKSQFEKKGEEVAKYKSQLAEKERQNLQMKREYQDRISKLETQQAETKRKYERQIRDLEKSLKDAKEQQKNKELELAKMEKELAQKEADYQKVMADRYKEKGELQEKIRDLEMKEKILEVELEREKRKNAEMRVEMNAEAHRQSISSLQQEHLEAIETIRKECNEKIEVHRSESEEKDAQIQHLTEELSRLSSQDSTSQ